MKASYKTSLYAFAGFVFLLCALVFAKTIELWNKYQEASDLLLLCEAKQIAVLNNNEVILKKLETFEANIKQSAKYNEILRQLGVRIDINDLADQVQKEAFKEVLNNKYLSE